MLTFVKGVVRTEEVVSEPDFGVGVEQMAIVIVSHSTTVLNVRNHVTNR